MSRISFVALLGCLWAAPASAEVTLPGGRKLERVDFERHVMGLFGRTGCNNGSCHGSFQGRGGFRLSLFGYDPEKDFLALTHDVMGRRLSTDPDESLRCSPTGQVRHGGGVRFGKDSWSSRSAWIDRARPVEERVPARSPRCSLRR
jgi:hypothetical protein